MTRILRLNFTLAVALALCVPAVAGATEEPLIPPGNSAVNQYTESFPTSRGNRDAEKPHKQSPRQVLGKQNAEKLEDHGSEGQAVADLAAETAPLDEAPAEVEADEQAATGGAGGGGGGSAGGAAGTDGDRGTTDKEDAGVATVEVAQPSGSSAVGEILAEATGSADSGEMGLLLPLTILAAIGTSIAFMLRRRRLER